MKKKAIFYSFSLLLNEYMNSILLHSYFTFNMTVVKEKWR